MDKPNEGEKKISRRQALGIGAGAIASVTGLGTREAEAQSLSPEQRTDLQGEMRGFLDQAAKYFERYTQNNYEGDLQQKVSGYLRDFNAALRGNASQGEQGYDRVGSQLRDIYSDTRHINHVQRRAAELLANVEFLLRLASGAFLMVATEAKADLRREHGEVASGLTALRQRYGLPVNPL